MLHHEGHGAHGAHGHGGHDGHSSASSHDDNNILAQVVKRLEVELATPEMIFIAQDDAPEVNNYMYFIAKGDCFVRVKDRLNEGNEEIRHRTLLPGDHFGVSYNKLDNNIGNITGIPWLPENSECGGK